MPRATEHLPAGQVIYRVGSEGLAWRVADGVVRLDTIGKGGDPVTAPYRWRTRQPCFRIGCAQGSRVTLDAPGSYNSRMNGAPLKVPPEIPEWRRIGPFLAFAIGLHLAVLLFPLKLSIARLEIPPPVAIMVRLVDAVSPPAPMPMHAAPAIAPQALPTPARERRAVAPRRILAMQPEQAAPTPSFSIPAPEAVPAAPVAPAAPSMASSTGAAPRLDAAYLNNPRPAYPPLSRRLGEEGRVLLRVRVSAEGYAVAVDLEKSSNFERLDEAARHAVARWRFVPARRGDEPVEGSVIVPIVFRLDG